ncbi:MAG TPA: aminotransferase class III-fold pyridoxal phosphate-dependent enzyme [Thermoanaerobaculia bacterium]|nr:aminotransferase class III-fold pyridoxal phosphate-dependent enzyme [Thermoanaerobaculia bacterium]
MGKAISGGFAPMGATIVTRKVAKSVEGEAGFYSTYGWHPSTVDIAIRNIRWVIRHQSRLLHHAAEISAYFDQRLAAMNFGDLKAIRIRGMAIAVEAGDGEDYVSEIADRCNKNGLLVTTAGNAITMFPPLTLDRRTAKAGLDILERSLR